MYLYHVIGEDFDFIESNQTKIDRKSHFDQIDSFTSLTHIWSHKLLEICGETNFLNG